MSGLKPEVPRHNSHFTNSPLEMFLHKSSAVVNDRSFSSLQRKRKQRRKKWNKLFRGYVCACGHLWMSKEQCLSISINHRGSGTISPTVCTVKILWEDLYRILFEPHPKPIKYEFWEWDSGIVFFNLLVFKKKVQPG